METLIEANDRLRQECFWLSLPDATKFAHRNGRFHVMFVTRVAPLTSTVPFSKDLANRVPFC
jgi:hypothetical protein